MSQSADTEGREETADGEHDGGEEAETADGSADGDVSTTVELPWIDDPVELPEAVELLASASEDDGATLSDLSERVERLERRIAGLEDGGSVACPSCDGDGEVYKAGVGAAKLASQDALSDANAHALNVESHVCLDCRESFTPSYE